MHILSRRDLAFGSAALLLTALPDSSAIAGDQAPPSSVDLSFVRPELRPFAAQIIKTPRPDLSQANLAASRQGMAASGHPALAAPAYVRRSITGPSGAPDVPLYIVNARPGSSRPAILHMHGGGYVMGSAASSLFDLQTVASALDCVIVTVEYRLAPETGYAGSIEDNYVALRWLHDHASELGADPGRIAVMGESAGGGHAALLAMTAYDRGEVPLAFQALIYPMLDDRTGTTVTPPSPIGSLVWTPARNRFGWQSFLGMTPGSSSVPTRAVPARRLDLKGMPATFIGVGSIDLFVDEDLAFARRLIDAGVPTEVMVVPGAFHGFDGLAPQTIAAKTFTAAKLGALRRAFGMLA